MRKEGAGIKHIPTDETRKLVISYVIAGLPYHAIAKALRISEPTLYNYYQDILDTAKEGVISELSGTLVQKARKGDLGALCFYLKTQGRWRETNNIEHTGGETPIKLLVDTPQPLPIDDWLKRFAKPKPE